MANLPAGNFLTTVSGKQCTAVPRSIGGGGGGGSSSSAAATTTTTSAAAETTSVQSTPPPAIETSQQELPPVAAPTKSPPPLPPAKAVPPSPESAPPLPPPPPPTDTASTSSALAVIPPASTSVVPSVSVPSVESAVPTTTSAVQLSTSTPTTLIQVTSGPISIPSALPILASTSSSIGSENIASKSTTPTTSFDTPLAQLQSETPTTLTPSSTILSIEDATSTGLSSLEMPMPTSTISSAASSEVSPADGGISSNLKPSVAPLVGGVLGSLAIVAIVAALLFFFLKRRKAKRDSLLTPLTSANRTEFYRDEKSAGAAQFDEKWAPDVATPTQGKQFKFAAAAFTSRVVGLGATLKAKVTRNRSASPSVNLNRGNSQFLDGPIPQHSRNNSSLSGSSDRLPARDRLANWATRLKDGIMLRLRLRKSTDAEDHFATARSKNISQAQLSNPQPDFSQLLGMDDRELQLESERRRANLSKTQSGSSLPPLGSLGLSFSLKKDPFADSAKAPDPRSNPFADPVTKTRNPFSDSVCTPQPSMAKQNTYMPDVRRSRGRSVDINEDLLAVGDRRPSTTNGGPVSRYPSSIALSRDSYRDTVFSSFSENVRKGKGRSDPFDLERTELWQPSTLSTPRVSTRLRGDSISKAGGGNSRLPPLTTSNLRTQEPSAYGKPRVVSQTGGPRNSAGTYESKYSSGVSSLSAWGDPGPDLGPGSTNTSMRGNVSSNGGSRDFGRMGMGGDGEVSPLSFDGGNTGRGVGKAM